MKKLSIGMIVKNEAENLEKTLQALQPLRDAVPSELIIADTGSTDDTLAIAERYGDKVFTIEWEDDFAKARNATLAQATGEWFFFIDADEELRDHQELAKFLLMPQSKQYQSILIPIYNVTFIKDNSWNVFWVGRIFRRQPGVYFKGKIHEQPINLAPQYTLRKTNLFHTGYDNENIEKMLKKSVRNLALIEKILEEENDPKKRAKSYLDGTDACFLNKVDEILNKGVFMANEAIKIIQQWPLSDKERKYYLARAYSLLTKSCINKQNWFAGKELCQEYFDKQPDRGSHDMDIYFAQILAEYNLNDFRAAQKSGEAYLRCTEQDIVEASRVFIILTISKKDDIRFLLSDCCQQLGEYDTAWDYAMQIEKEIVYGRIVAECQFQLAISHNMPKRLPEFYEAHPEDRERLLVEMQKAALKSKGEKRLEFQRTLRNLPQNCMVQQTLLCCTDDRSEFLRLIEDEQGFFAENLGSVVDQWMRFDLPAEVILNRIDIGKLNQYLFSCSEQIHPGDFANHTAAYYSNQAPAGLGLKELQAARYILGYNLLQEDIHEDTVIVLWQLLAEFGYQYAQQLYRIEVWKEENLYLFNGLDQFIYYSQVAIEARKKQDLAKYVQYLRQAVVAYPQAKHVVDILVKDIENKTQPEITKKQEMDQLAEIVKQQIRQMISLGKETDAATLLLQLTEIVPEDPELPSLSVLIKQPAEYMQ